MKTPQLAPITADRAFEHVADSYRWLAAAGRSWTDLVEHGLSRADLRRVDALVPNAAVAVRASLLTYARSLIEFYRPPSSNTSDIRADLFKIKVNQLPSVPQLMAFKDRIDKHLAHLTPVRDPAHPDRFTHDRIADPQITPLVNLLVDVLREVTEQQPGVSHVDWFKVVLDHVRQRLASRISTWPNPPPWPRP
jgi:hypothetical protein